VKQLLAHLVGDYIVQSDYLAKVKVRRTREGVLAAAVHAGLYTACFVPLTRSPWRLALIGVTHGLLDHYRPLPWVIATKDWLLAPRDYEVVPPQDVPFWLHIVVDNSVHLLINELALSTRR
jgi:hypothetical protein